jgi:hypothetical protein
LHLLVKKYSNNNSLQLQKLWSGDIYQCRLRR